MIEEHNIKVPKKWGRVGAGKKHTAIQLYCLGNGGSQHL